MEERKDKYMAKGIIYLMTTVVSGLIKIGKTRNDQFEKRMRVLESNGYANITGLKREFAIEVDGYDDKEIAKSLLASLDGKQIYPKDKSKKEVFKESTEEIKLKSDVGFIPDGDYVLNRSIKGFGKVNGKATVKDGVFKVLKGSLCGKTGKGYIPVIRRNAKIKDNILQEDIVCMTPSSAGWIVIGKPNNGWLEWKDLQGNSIEKYRDKENS